MHTILDKTYTIQNFQKTRNNYEIFILNLNNSFSNNGILTINAKYNYINNIDKFSHVYKFYNNNIKFKEMIIDHKDNIINDVFEINTVKSSNIRLSIFLINNKGNNSSITLHKYNTIQIKYLDNTNSKMETDISNNLINININEDNIAINKGEIDYLEKNKIYLKNLYNELFHNEKTKIVFSNDKYFYEKVFDDNYSINDFIEIYFDFILEIDNISNINYVKIRYQIFDEDDNRIHIKTGDLNNYNYFSNNIIIDDKIFYNFTKNTKKIKMNIKFQLIVYKNIILHYLTNENFNRFILKHYSS